MPDVNSKTQSRGPSHAALHGVVLFCERCSVRVPAPTIFAAWLTTPMRETGNRFSNRKRLIKINPAKSHLRNLNSVGQGPHDRTLEVVGMFLENQGRSAGNDGSAEAGSPSSGVVIPGIGGDHAFAGSGKNDVRGAEIGKCASLVTVRG